MILKNVNTKYGPRAELVKWIYISIVRLRILYEYYIWGHKANKPEILQSLQRINNLACKIITPIRRTTPRKSLKKYIYDIILLDLQGKLEAISTQKRNKEILKLKWTGYNPDKKTYIGHRHHWHCQTDETNYGFSTDTDRIKEITPP